MNKDLIDLQRNSKAVCVIVKTDEYKSLSPIVSMEAGVSDSFLNQVPFANKLNDKCKKYEICYFVIKNIDKIDKPQQDRFVGLVKDREYNGYNLPSNCIIVFTVENEKSLKDVSSEIYRFAVIDM